MPPAARVTDIHVCPIIVHGPNLIVPPCEATVITAMLPQARMSDMSACGAPIIKGSLTVLVGNKPAARQGDPTGHGGIIASGAPTVLIGDCGKGDCDCMKAAAKSGSATVSGGKGG